MSTYNREETMLLDAAVSVVQRQALVTADRVDITATTITRTFVVEDMRSMGGTLSREEALEQLMEWCGREIAALRAAAAVEPAQVEAEPCTFQCSHGWWCTAGARGHAGSHTTISHACHDPLVDRGPGSHGRVRAPESTSGSLDAYFTLAFERSIMLQTITFDRVGGRVDLSRWFEGVVPECYRGQLPPIIDDTFIAFRGHKLTDGAMSSFVDTLRRGIFARLEPVRPSQVHR